ncbi:MAG TPA: hypothetical protein VKP04_03145, partial [Ktedonobacteraceae bacterium]|nr:hypothetical protein [Ktedonobacteraceae bacterium]
RAYVTLACRRPNAVGYQNISAFSIRVFGLALYEVASVFGFRDARRLSIAQQGLVNGLERHSVYPSAFHHHYPLP